MTAVNTGGYRPPPAMAQQKPVQAIAKAAVFRKPQASDAAAPKIVAYAIDKFGKTTLGAFAEKPVILMSKGETGYYTLFASGLAPEVPCAELLDWETTKATLDSLITSDFKTVVLDILGGFEYLCHSYVCRTQFKDDWGDTGFASYAKGIEISMHEWKIFLAKLDALSRAGKTVILLAHSKVKTWNNPMGTNFDRYIAVCADKTWDATKAWADAILFGNFATVVQSAQSNSNIAKGKGKGIGGTERWIYTQRCDAFDAGNRYGMDEKFRLPDDPTQSFQAIWDQIKGKKQADVPPVAEDGPPE